MTSGSSSKARDKQSLSYVVRTFVAGGIAGCVAKTAVAPLDRVKILFQASNPDYQKYTGSWTGVFDAAREVRKRDGLRGLFQGHSATLLRIFPYAAIKFLAYDQIHHALMPTSADETNFLRFLAGSSSGALSVILTYPLEVLRVRLAFETRHTSRPTLSGTVRTIYNEGISTRNSSSSLNINPSSPSSSTTIATPPSLSGASSLQRTPLKLFSVFPILKFYRGFTVSLIGMIPYAGTSFLVWGSLRARFIPVPPQDPSSSKRSKPPSRPVADLVIGAIAGVTSQTVSYPFEIVRRRMQVGGLVRPNQWVGFGETVRAVWLESGWRGFFVGLSIGFLKSVPMTAVSYATWEGMKRVLDVD